MSVKSKKAIKMNELEKNSSDELAAKTASDDLLSSKSKMVYESAYTAFVNWRKQCEKKSSSESVLTAYFEELSKKYKPSTLWSTYSMLKRTISMKEKIDIGAYPILIAFLKKQSSGFQSKKSNVLSSEEVQRFLTEAPDNEYLATKVALIFGVCGACRSNELVNIRLQDITKQGRLIVVNLPDTKTKRPRTFVISDEFADTVVKYEALRPATTTSDRFFVNYQKGKCTSQVIGVHKFSKMPRRIATFLNLPNADAYTGHAFRRTSATLLTDSGAIITTLKRHRGWKSSNVAAGYIEESIQNKTKISNLLPSAIHKLSTPSTSTISSTSPVPLTSSIPATSLMPAEARENSDENPPFKRQKMNEAATGTSTITTSLNKTTTCNNCSLNTSVSKFDSDEQPFPSIPIKEEEVHTRSQPSSIGCSPCPQLGDIDDEPLPTMFMKEAEGHTRSQPSSMCPSLGCPPLPQLTISDINGEPFRTLPIKEEVHTRSPFSSTCPSLDESLPNAPFTSEINIELSTPQESNCSGHVKLEMPDRTTQCSPASTVQLISDLMNNPLQDEAQQDQYDIFGRYVASVIRSMKDPNLRIMVQNNILRAIITGQEQNMQ